MSILLSFLVGVNIALYYSEGDILNLAAAIFAAVAVVVWAQI